MAQINLGHVVGPGVPSGGTANQVLKKASSTNYDDAWVDVNSLPAIEVTQGAMAIIATGNTHVAITSGQYVYVRGHGTLSDGLYKASADIAANGTLSSSNLTAVSGGGMNSLKSDIDTLNSKFFTSIPENTDLDNLTEQGFYGCPNSTRAATLINSPTTAAAFTMLVILRSTSTPQQVAFLNATIYTRFQSSSGWQPWRRIRLNTSDEDDIIKKNFIIAKSSSGTITAAASSNVVLYFFGGASGVIGSMPISCTSSSVVMLGTKTGASEITVTRSGATVTIANGNTSYATIVQCLILAGDVTVPG